MTERSDVIDEIDFGPDGLVPAIAQDRTSGRVLMLAWANREAVERTLSTGDAHFWSRSRKELWRKGATSGNVLRNTTIHADCDADALLMLVDPGGPACHTGASSCFDAPPPATATEEGAEIGRLWATLRARARQRPEGSYTVRLLDDANLRFKKLGEESTELVVALSTGDKKGVAEEAADLMYHVMAALLGAGVEWSDVEAVLAQRRS